MTYGNGVQLTMSYNAREAATRYEISNLNNGNGTTLSIGKTYDYYDDGRIRFVGDLYDNRFDRKYTYNHTSRLQDALTGGEARGGTTADGPYRESYSYDVWGNTITETKRLWTGNPTTTNASFTNNRRQYWAYDANGLTTAHYDEALNYQHEYDAAGKRMRFIPLIDWVDGQPAVEMDDTSDGNAMSTKHTDIRRSQDWETGQTNTTTNVTYYLHSMALGGQVVAELDAQGNKRVGHVYLQGMLLASEVMFAWPATNATINWQHTDPATGAGATSAFERGLSSTQELDPLGADVTYSPAPPEPETYELPAYLDPARETHYLIEGEAVRTREMEIGMAQYVDTMDMIMAREAWRRGERDRAQDIVARNPNVGIEYLRWDHNVERVTEHGFLWGAQAAGFLLDLGNELDSGKLVPLGASSKRHYAHAQNSERELNHTTTKKSPCSNEPSANSREVLLVARSVGGENGVPRNEGHAALVFNAGTNDQADHYLVQAGPNNDRSRLVGSVRQASAGWWQTYRQAEGANWTTGESMQVPVEVDARFYLPASLSTVSNFGRIANSLNSGKQAYDYEKGPNSNTYVHQFINKLCGPGFTVTPGGSMPLKGW